MRYLIGNNLDSLTPKFRGQISAAINMGLDVWYIVCREEGIYLYHNDDQKIINPIKYHPTKSITFKIIYYSAIYKTILLVLSQNKFDFVYLRSMFVTPLYIKLLKQIKAQRAKCIIEIPTYPKENEYSSEKSIIKKIMLFSQKQLEDLTSKYVDLYLLIGKHADSYLGQPALNIENGVDIESIPLREPKYSEDEIHLLAIASMSRWHGYDRIIQGISEYSKVQNNLRVICNWQTKMDGFWQTKFPTL
jgi:vacuolar-type H+-ATPase subunit F/Vma7